MYNSKPHIRLYLQHKQLVIHVWVAAVHHNKGPRYFGLTDQILFGCPLSDAFPGIPAVTGAVHWLAKVDKKDIHVFKTMINNSTSYL